MSRGRGEGRSRRLTLEELEERIAPAGGISAAVRGGSLFVTGDELGNDIEIDQDGLPADQYRITSGSDPTLINGEAGPLIFEGVFKDVKIKLGDGDDALVMDCDEIGRNLMVDGGNGNNTENINDLFGNLLQVGGNVRIMNGDGGNYIEMYADIDRTMSINNGDGDNEIRFQGGVGGNASINNGEGYHILNVSNCVFDRNVQIRNSGGDSSMGLDRVDVYGNLTIKNGSGRDFFSLSSSYTARNVNINNGHGVTAATWVSGSEIGGNVNVRNLSGTGSFTMQNSCVVGKVSLNNSNGSTHTLFQQSDVFSDFTIRGGNGSDYLWVSDGRVGRNVNVNFGDGGSDSTISLGTLGGLKVKAQSGSDLFTAEYSTVWGRTNINLGGDNDELRMDYSHVRTAIINVGSGDDLFTAVGSTVWGRTNMNLGAGNDELRIDDSYLGPAVINAGSGHDLIALETETPPGFTDSLRFSGPVKIIGGSGDDAFLLGVGGESGASAIFGGVLHVNGGGGVDTLDHIGNGNIYFGSVKVTGTETVV
ncbi:MAG: autotransporter outer membrane beta-barrel domain-containing protein [Planctomycetota bacterium]|jgi:hypothetical protein